LIRQLQICLEKRFYRPNISPIAVVFITVYLIIGFYSFGNNLLTKVGGIGIVVKQLLYNSAFKNIDPHGCQIMPALTAHLLRSFRLPLFQFIAIGFFYKTFNISLVIGFHDAKAGGIIGHDRNSGNSNISITFIMLFYHLPVVHLIELVAG